MLVTNVPMNSQPKIRPVRRTSIEPSLPISADRSNAFVYIAVDIAPLALRSDLQIYAVDRPGARWSDL